MAAILEEVQNKKVNFLENRKVIVRPIPERFNPHYTNMDKDHVGKFIFPGCKVTIRLPLSHTYGGLVRILNDEEREFFEKKLQKQPGELSFYKKDNNFWYDFKVVLEGTEKVLNLADPIENLQYRVLQVDPRVANSWEDRFNAECRWALVDETYQAKVNTKVTELRQKAYVALAKMEEDAPRMIEVLKLMGKTPAADASREFLYSQLGAIIEVTEDRKGVLSIHDFLEAIVDKNTKFKLILNDGVRLGEIKKDKTKYTLKSGDIIGLNMDEAIQWLKDPVNGEYVKIIELRIQTNK